MGWASSLVSPPDGDLTDFMRSCEQLRQRPSEVYHAGHGAPIEAHMRGWIGCCHTAAAASHRSLPHLTGRVQMSAASPVKSTPIPPPHCCPPLNETSLRIWLISMGKTRLLVRAHCRSKPVFHCVNQGKIGQMIFFEKICQNPLAARNAYSYTPPHTRCSTASTQCSGVAQR